ncbi:hypothetical protein E3N88_44496 [Mikania micrantha]|uniref:Uncharacterized protein n=1 Tax=Mikania micrantha TaxID=192012 RepID=A0A5N6LC45_9ASTR|nr:hypothetical protein E3N88_44496 [Mikania micrantha]
MLSRLIPHRSVDWGDLGSYVITRLLYQQRVFGLAGCGAHENSTVKRARAGAIQGWVTSLGSFHPGNRRQNRELLVGKADNIAGKNKAGLIPHRSVDWGDLGSYVITRLLYQQRVFGLAGCGAHENSTVKRARAGAIQGWVTSLGSFHPGNRRQNRELLVGKADNIAGSYFMVCLVV